MLSFAFISGRYTLFASYIRQTPSCFKHEYWHNESRALITCFLVVKISFLDAVGQLDYEALNSIGLWKGGTGSKCRLAVCACGRKLSACTIRDTSHKSFDLKDKVWVSLLLNWCRDFLWALITFMQIGLFAYIPRKTVSLLISAEQKWTHIFTKTTWICRYALQCIKSADYMPIETWDCLRSLPSPEIRHVLANLKQHCLHRKLLSMPHCSDH